MTACSPAGLPVRRRTVVRRRSRSVRRRALAEIPHWCDRVAAAGWRGPGHDPGAGLLKSPAAGLFDRMVPTTQRSEVALAGAAAEVVRHRVVLVALGRGAQAAG